MLTDSGIWVGFNQQRKSLAGGCGVGVGMGSELETEVRKNWNMLHGRRGEGKQTQLFLPGCEAKPPNLGVR